MKRNKDQNNQQKNNEVARETDYQFLLDQPLSAKELENIRFGHEGIAKTLQNMITKCPTPFTVGLFGKWGVGKSTIINLLQAGLTEQKDIAVVVYDVWKHEKDTLRREFLLDIEKEFRQQRLLSPEFKLDKKVASVVSRSFQSGVRFNIASLKQLWIYVVIVALLVAIWATYDFNLKKIPEVFGLTFVVALLFAITQTITKVVTADTTTETEDRLQSPQEFEKQFERLLCNIQAKKMVIVIDNLDRCSHDRAVELLSTIKTYLEKDKCIFLIPCDDEAIKKHLANVYLKNQISEEDVSFSPDEFLRKFFNAFLKIPEFIGTELDDYTRELLQQTEVKELDDESVVWVTTKAFRDNPRQIKQFINTLLSHRLLAKQREGGDDPLIQEAGAITKNVSFLAKFLIMLQRFPNAMQRLNERSMQLSEVISDFESFINDSRDKEPEEALKKEFDNFKQFLEDTPHIDTNNIGLFFRFKQSKEELMVPEVDKLTIALIDNDSKYVKERLEKLKSSNEDLNNFEKIVCSQLAQNKHKPMNLVGIISSSLASLNALQIELRLNFYREIGNTIRLNLLPHLHNFKPSAVFEELLERDRPSRNRVLKQYVEILANQKEEKPTPKIATEFAYELISKIIEHENWFLEKALKERVSNALADAYITDTEVAKLFRHNPSAQKRFLTESVLNKFVGSISDDEVENKDLFTGKIDLFLSFDKNIISEVVVQSLVQKIKELILGETLKPYPEREYIKENLLEKSCEILSEFGSLVKEEKVLVVFSDTVIQSTDAIGDWTQKRIFILILLKLVNFVPESKGQEIGSRIQQFFASTSLEGIKYVLGKVENKSGLIQQYSSIFGQRVLQDKSFLDLLYPEAPKDIRTEWIIDLIQQNPGMALTKIEELKYKIDDKKAIIGTLLQEVGRSGYQEKDRFYKAVNEMRCAGDASLRSMLATQIKILLRNLDQNSQLVGLKAYQGAIHLSALLKREISREVVEWLRTLDPSNAYQPSSTRSILVNWDNLEEPVKRDFLDFVFNKLINRGTSEQSINLGFEILVKRQPKYEEYKIYYDDVYAKTESEGNEQLKHAIVKGLKVLIPAKPNKKNKEFWNKVKKLSQPE